MWIHCYKNTDHFKNFQPHQNQIWRQKYVPCIVQWHSHISQKHRSTCKMGSLQKWSMSDQIMLLICWCIFLVTIEINFGDSCQEIWVPLKSYEKWWSYCLREKFQQLWSVLPVSFFRQWLLYMILCVLVWFRRKLYTLWRHIFFVVELDNSLLTVLMGFQMISCRDMLNLAHLL